MKRALSFLALTLASVMIFAATVRAGDRPLELLLADMSPDGSPPDCMRDLVRELRRREPGMRTDPVNLTRMGESGIRRLAHREDDSPFLSWTVDDLRPVLLRRRETPLDAIALVDCRAEAGEADLLVLSPAGGLARVSLRRTPIDAERASFLGRTVLLHAWTGFNP